VLGGLLLWAAVSKLLAPGAFFSELTDYKLPVLPLVTWQIAAVSLPWFELFCGAALLINFWPETVQPVVTLLFALFAAMLLQAVVRGLDLDCGCFGGAPSWLERPNVALIRALILLGLSWVLMKPAPRASALA